MKPGKRRNASFSHSWFLGKGGINFPSILSKIDRYYTLNWLGLNWLKSKLCHLNKHTICNFCKRKACKISRLCEWDSNPWPLWHWCSALTKLANKWTESWSVRWFVLNPGNDKWWIWKSYSGLRTNCCYLTLFFLGPESNSWPGAWPDNTSEYWGRHNRT